MNDGKESARSCANCRNEDRGYCEWARAIGDFCPPWVSEARAILWGAIRDLKIRTSLGCPCLAVLEP